MSTKLIFKGNPMSKDNEKIVNRFGKVYLSSKFKNYERDIQYQFLYQKQGFVPLVSELSITLIVYHRNRRCCDLSNIPKSILDALQGFLYKNDNQIVELHLYKQFDKDNPRIELEYRLHYKGEINNG